MNSLQIVNLIIILCAVWHAFHSIEVISANNSNKLNLIHITSNILNSQKWPSLLSGSKAFKIIIILRLFLSLAGIFCVVYSFWIWPILLLLALTSLYHAWYRRVGGDGSEEMGLIVIVSITISSIYNSETVAIIVLYFLGAQCLLSYLTAGIAKLNSKTWRTGAAIGLITRSESYGLPFINRLIKLNPTLSIVIAWAVIMFEVILPFAVFWGLNGGLILVIVGVLFHISSAIIMGLNGFPLSFFSTYPAILFISNQFELI